SVRLARARERLRQRLVRRGLGLSAGLVSGLLDSESKGMPLPVGLLTTTLKGGAALVSGVRADISQAVFTLTEGVIRAMWIQKLKTTLLAGFLVLGLTFTSLGGVSWHRAGQILAQTPLDAREVSKERMKDDDRSLEEQERKLALQLKAIREQRARLHLRRASAVLEEIEASLKKLRAVTAGSEKRRRAVDAFE